MSLQDFRRAWRTLLLRSNRAYTAASVLTLALGVGAVTAIFSLVHAVLLAPLPYRDASTLVHIGEANAQRGLTDYAVSVPNFLSWVDQAKSFAALAAIRQQDANVGDAGDVERVAAIAASANLWQTLGVPLLHGREVSGAEDQPPGAGVVIVGEGFWRRRFGADPTLVGRSIRVDGRARTVIGIAPQDLGFSSAVDVWLPLAADAQAQGRGDRRLDVIGRLAPGATLEAARAEMSAIGARLALQFPDTNAGWSASVLPVRDWIVSDTMRTRLMLLLAAVLVLLLVACTNVANLQVARAAERARELGVRQALGATPSRLLGQMAVESLTLCALGGALGLALGWLGVQAAIAALPASTPRLAAVTINAPVALAALAAIGLTAIVFALAPAAVASSADLGAALQRAGRSSSDARRTPLRRALVVVQFALATTLVVGAGVLLENLVRLQNVPLGFAPERVLTARLAFPAASEDRYPTESWAVYSRLLDEVRGLPGVEAVGLSSEIPMGEVNTSIEVGPITPTSSPTDTGIQVSWRIVTPDYLSAMGIPLHSGRLFDPSNEPRGSVMLSAGLARKLFPGEDPLGRRVWLGNGQLFTVVGVVGDVRQLGLADDPTPTLYLPTSWYLWPTMTLAVRAAGDPTALIAPLRDAARRVSPEQPLFDIRTMSTVIDANVAAPRLQTAVLVLFAAVSLLLAALGVAGVMAYVVARSAPQLAMRMALGATPRRVVRHVVGDGAVLCAAGVAIGGAVAVGLAQAFGGVIGAQSTDLELTLAATATVLLAAGLIACWLPARRAARISPASNLRGD